MFSLSATRKFGRFSGTSEHVGHSMTYEILRFTKIQQFTAMNL